MTLLSETAHVLTHTHKRRTFTEDGDVYGDEPPLLDVLNECVTNPSTNGGQGGNSTRAGLPINADALVLWQEITDTIDGNWPGRGNPAYVRVPYTHRLTAWVNSTIDPRHEESLHVLVQSWTHRIMEMLEPTKRVPVPGVCCPVCGWDRTVTEDDGEFTYRPALVAYPTADPVKVACTVVACSGEWSGPAVVDTFMQSVTVDRAVM